MRFSGKPKAIQGPYCPLQLVCAELSKFVEGMSPEVMNERVFLAFRGLAIFIHCFPGLGPSERHTPCVLCLLVDQKLALRWTDISREKALFLLLRNYGGPPPYSEATPQSKTPPSGLRGGDPFERSRRAS